MMAKTNPLFPTLQPKVEMGTKTGHIWRHYTPPPAVLVHGGEKTWIKEIHRVLTPNQTQNCI